MQVNLLVDNDIDDSVNNKDLSRLERRLIALLQKGALTRDQMVKKLGIPRTTIFDALKRLIVKERVKKYPLYCDERVRGRPKILFSLMDEEY